jgi:hypothetical protein
LKIIKNKKLLKTIKLTKDDTLKKYLSITLPENMRDYMKSENFAYDKKKIFNKQCEEGSKKEDKKCTGKCEDFIHKFTSYAFGTEG